MACSAGRDYINGTGSEPTIKQYLIILKMKFLYKICLLLLLSAIGIAKGQNKVIKIGDTVPELYFDKIINFHEQKATLSNFKGKAVILDFWATWCKPCIGAFPKNDSLQKMFADKLQFMLVSNEDPSTIENLYRRLKSTYNISLPSASDTSGKISTLFNVRVIPHYVWINANGIVKAITGSHELNVKNVNNFINGKPLDLITKIDTPRLLLDYTKPLFLDSNLANASKIKTYSMLTGDVQGALSLTSMPKIGLFKDRRIMGTRISVGTLLGLVYGKEAGYKTFPYKKMRFMDNGQIIPRPTTLYCYDLIIPEPDSVKLIQTAKEDLFQKFNYRAFFQKHPAKCLVLSQLKSSNLKPSKSKDTVMEFNQFYMNMKNQSIKTIVLLLGSIQGKNDIIEVLDETNFKNNIDIELKGNLLNISELNTGLRKYGLVAKIENREVDFIIASTNDNHK